MNFLWLFTFFSLNACSASNSFVSIPKFISANCPNTPLTGTLDLFEKLNIFYNQLKVSWRNEYLDYPNSYLIWKNLMNRRPDLLLIHHEIIEKGSIVKRENDFKKSCSEAIDYLCNVGPNQKNMMMLLLLFNTGFKSNYSPYLYVQSKLRAEMHNKKWRPSLFDELFMEWIEDCRIYKSSETK